jgi:hypothetical protein
LKDEVLQKALEADATVIPRYDVALPDGTIIAENVQLILKNSVLTAGTPLNKNTLLKDTTAVLFGLVAESAIPDDVLVAIRNSTGYCPKLKILGAPGATISVQEANSTEAAVTYTMPTSGVLTVDVLHYGVYKIWSVSGSTYTSDKYVDVNENKQYSVDVFSYVTYAKFTVTQEVGATIVATHTDGSVSSGVVGADKTCTIPLYKQGTWNCVATYDGVAAQTISIPTTSSTNGTTVEKSPVWTKVVVQTTSGATVTMSKSGVSKKAISVGGSCTFWMPDTDTWSIAASLNGKHGSGFTAPTLYGTKTVSISLS